MTAPADDIDRIMAVMAAAFDPQFGEAWTRRQVEDALLTGLCHYRLISSTGRIPEPGGEAAGFYLARHIAGEEELLLIAITPEHQRKGLGSALLHNLKHDAILREASRLLLEMRSGNPAELLYRNHRFQPIGTRPNYYRTGLGKPSDAITFACDLRS